MSVEPNRLQHSVAFAALGAALALIVGIHAYRPAPAGLWLETFFNSAHVLVFMLVALSIFTFLRFLPRLRFSTCVVGAAISTLLLGLLSEAAQIQGPRDASFEDLIADWLGGASALSLLLACSGNARLTRKLRSVFGALGVALLLIALAPLLTVSAAYLERYRNLPVIFSFDFQFADTFAYAQNASVEFSNRPFTHASMAKVTFNNGPWPGLVMHDLWPDWSDYSTLAIELESADSQPFELRIRVHDWIHSRGDQPFSDRFNTTYVLATGAHVLRIPLTRLKQAPANRDMDLERIHGLVIFATGDEIGKSFTLRQIRLEN